MPDAAPATAETLAAAGADRGELPAVAAMLMVFAALSLTCGVLSDGFLTADACTHYLYAKFSLREPHYLVDVWGRPVCTALYALPAAAAGRTGVRGMSLALALLCALTTYRTAIALGFTRPALALLFTLAQPVLFLHSFSEMTELPFATLLALAFLAYVRRRFFLAAFVVALTPLARPEGFGFAGLMTLDLVVRRRWPGLAVLPLPLLLWNYAGWELHGREGPWWRWLASNWPYAGNSLYPSGSVFQFAALLPAVVSPLILPATLIGLGQSVRTLIRVDAVRRPARFGQEHGGQSVRTLIRPDAGTLASDRVVASGDREASGVTGLTRHRRHLRVCRAHIAFCALFVLGAHSLLFRLGKLGSFGEARYLLVAAPFWALASAWGWQWAFDRIHWRHPLRWAAAAALAPVLVNGLVPIVPLRLANHWAAARHAAERFQGEFGTRGTTHIMAAHPGVFYALDVSFTDRTKVRPWNRDTVANPPANTLLVWDPIYGPRNASGARAVRLEEVEAAGWIGVPSLDAALAEITRQPDEPGTPDTAASLGARGEWRVFVSPATKR